jgi:hypothetical protein
LIHGGNGNNREGGEAPLRAVKVAAELRECMKDVIELGRRLDERAGRL